MASPRPLRRFRETLTEFVTPGPRMVDEIECVASVLLAIPLAHAIGAHSVAWAAFTGFALMRGHVSETLLRGLMRIVGTAIGAGLALLVVPYAVRSLPGAALAAALVGAIGLYGMLTAKRAYAWLLFGLTFEMILLDKIEHPAVDAIAFVETPLLEVMAGTVACVAVSLLTTLTARRRWPGLPPQPATRIGWHPNAARHAAQAGTALALLPVLHALFGIPELEQAGITVMAVMIVPVAGLDASGLDEQTVIPPSLPCKRRRVTTRNMEADSRVATMSIGRGPAAGIVAVFASVALVVLAAEHGSFSRFARGGGFVPAIPGVTVGDTEDRMPVVTSVRSDGAAERAGLQVGDEIVTVDGRRVRNVASLRDVMNAEPGDRRLALHIRRGDALWTVAIDRAEPSADGLARTGIAHGAENTAD